MATKKSDRVKQAVGRDMTAREWDSLERHTVTVGIRLDKDIRDRLKRYCDSRGLTLSGKIREIIMTWLLDQRII